MISRPRFPLPFRLPWSCLVAAAGLFTVASSGYGTTSVTISAGVTTSPRGYASTATFSDVTSLIYASTTYSYASGGTNGSLTLSGLTIGTAATPGSFVSGSVDGQYRTPDTTSGTFLAIGGTQRPGPVSLTFSNAANNYFGLEWASPDSYNSVTLTFKDNTTATYTPGTTGFLATATTNSFVEFVSTQPITGVSLSSTSPAFELDNIAFGVVPEPATWAAGGLTVLAGATALRRRRMSSK